MSNELTIADCQLPISARTLELSAAGKAEEAKQYLLDGKRYLAREALREAVSLLNEAEVEA